METKVKDNSKAVNNAKTDKTTAFIHGNPVNKEAAKPQPEAENPKAETAGTTNEQPVKQAEQPQAEAPKADQVSQASEQPKAEVKAEPAKPVRNLEQTIKYLEEMHSFKMIRDKYVATINNLDEFEIDLKKETDETDGNYYQGCVLTIEDDSRRKFTTKNPVIIWTVAQQIIGICESKLAEVEARLVITA